MRGWDGTSILWWVSETNSNVDKLPKVFLPLQVIRRKYVEASASRGYHTREIYITGKSENGRGGGIQAQIWNHRSASHELERNVSVGFPVFS